MERNYYSLLILNWFQPLPCSAGTPLEKGRGLYQVGCVPVPFSRGREKRQFFGWGYCQCRIKNWRLVLVAWRSPFGGNGKGGYNPNLQIFKFSNNEIIGQLKSLAKVEQIANKTTAPPKFGGAVRFCTLVGDYWYRITASDAPIFIVPEQLPSPFSSILPSRQTAVHVPTGSL